MIPIMELDINNKHSPTSRTLDFKIDLAHDDLGI